MEEIKIRTGGPPDREAMLAMYRDFEPLGAALGLPPFTESGRQSWIDRLLNEAFHWLAVRNGERVVGHTILADSGPGEAEIAFFVHQSFRGRRIATLLVVAALAAARERGYRRIWATVCADNVPALKLLRARGFERSRISAPTMELELLLRQPLPATPVAVTTRSGVTPPHSSRTARPSEQSRAVGLNQPQAAGV
jgi:GNAT superfamily N-acetyltransferase